MFVLIVICDGSLQIAEVFHSRHTAETRFVNILINEDAPILDIENGEYEGAEKTARKFAKNGEFMSDNFAMLIKECGIEDPID